VRELNDGSAAKSAPAPSGKVKRFASYITGDNACSACYASVIFALSRLNPSELGRMKDKICIGQGFTGKRGKIGIGRCCADFDYSCSGCPPSGVDVLNFLRSHILFNNPVLCG
jgi:hypothetical protein